MYTKMYVHISNGLYNKINKLISAINKKGITDLEISGKVGISLVS